MADPREPRSDLNSVPGGTGPVPPGTEFRSDLGSLGSAIEAISVLLFPVVPSGFPRKNRWAL